MEYNFKPEPVIEYTINWIRAKFLDCKRNLAIIGLSGGKDSAIAAKLCALALGESCIKTYFLSDGSVDDEAQNDAEKIAAIFNINLEIINIRPITSAFEQVFNEDDPDTGYINRTRMSILYNYATKLRGLVVNTSNLSEIRMGNFIKWGDSVGDIAPLVFLTVTELLQIAKELRFPTWLINKKPDGGIRQIISGNRTSSLTDEERMGISYKKIDEILRSSEPKPLTPEEEQMLSYGEIRARLEEPFVKCCKPPVSMFYDFI